ncbi:TPA: TraR/DksA family transcriptional regulator [Yersinia enterocolitica]|uniref:TraR/DksA family transcriptional regulator n=1 Tax=Yersinia enterocolitica TaxID=630 RepID=UPI0005E8070E|nr:TraR/DksA family transcriptional regulator [Yersinia enterocolitica]ELI8203691.1 TraR/DksA family transcriptional regulator [Yersinia enterocolitica]ELW7373485.1 TraR/DksA family transcriptional regulator [Yersinia enterocolitica]ELY5238420.1 TraR/DksA family transcriptional regulator [Yersinia enterocolitica]ELY5304487.1 TraR/DksA family transcriptional regulator [Yersinia enterocolitica]CQJ09620.1 DnaK suppressor protein [Yersinia enterocolitica]
MADLIDIAQERQEMVLAAQIANARSKPAAPSAFICESCEAAIPEQRRISVPGVMFCVTCQQIHEEKKKHYRGAL